MSFEDVVPDGATVPPNDDDLLTENIFNDPVEPDSNNPADAPDGEAPAAKVRKRLNIPRLNEERLCSDHGLPSLPALFRNVKFKGAGNETTNLKILLKQYEYWGNQLFPKFCFEDFVDKVEDLGWKPAVKNCVRRLRKGEDEPLPEEQNQANGQNGFDDDAGAMGEISAEFGAEVALAPSRLQESLPEIPATSREATSITDELRAKIQRNREIAMQRRAAREALSSQESNSEQIENTSIDTTQVSQNGTYESSDGELRALNVIQADDTQIEQDIDMEQEEPESTLAHRTEVHNLPDSDAELEILSINRQDQPGLKEPQGSEIEFAITRTTRTDHAEVTELPDSDTELEISAINGRDQSGQAELHNSAVELTAAKAAQTDHEEVTELPDSDTELEVSAINGRDQSDLEETHNSDVELTVTKATRTDHIEVTELPDSDAELEASPTNKQGNICLEDSDVEIKMAKTTRKDRTEVEELSDSELEVSAITKKNKSGLEGPEDSNIGLNVTNITEKDFSEVEELCDSNEDLEATSLAKENKTANGKT